MAAQAPTQYACPPLGSTISFNETYVRLADFSGDLCTLTEIVGGTAIKPVARAFDGRDWQASAGQYAGILTIECVPSTTACDMHLPPLQEDGVFRLTSYEKYVDPTDSSQQPAIVARFLEQASFGPTLDLLSEWNYNTFESSFEDWVADQMEKDATSHREFFRERSNPRWDKAYPTGRPGPHPCEPKSRWRNFAFSIKDARKKLTVHSLHDDGNAPYVLKVDGYVRTIVTDLVFESGPGNNNQAEPPPPVQLTTEYEFCLDNSYSFQESFSFPVLLKIPGESLCFQIQGGNPLVDISDDESLSEYNIIDLPNAGSSEFYGIDDTIYDSEYFDSYQAGDEFILAAPLTTSACDVLPDPWNNPDDSFPLAPIFGRSRINGTLEYLLYDPRLVLMENTIENPLADGGGEITSKTNGATFCSNAPRTFLNEEHCFLSSETTACSAATIPTFAVKLEHAFLTGLYNITGRYVYAVDNLPINNETYLDAGDAKIKRYIDLPCEKRKGRISRWMRVVGSFCEGDFSSVGVATAEAFSTLLRPGFEDPSNPTPLLKDVVLYRTQSCDEEDWLKEELGHVLSEGVCWKHVHPQHLNVYDLTGWVQEHPGGESKIQKWATGGSSILVFSNSSSHQGAGNYRFFENIVWNPELYPLLGKMDEVIPYGDLPTSLQSAEVELRFGSVSINPAGNGVLVCGSLGEVDNKPELGSGFDMTVFDRISGTNVDDDTTPSRAFARQRNTIWSFLALKSEDQLRQRMAFALSQILVVTPTVLSDSINTETMIQYYDIFVRNAFGNYRDILKQVAFSHRMGDMLSSVNSKSYQHSIDYERPAFPDENFAREIMQLFSIGLDMLNMDGTSQLDEDGNPIPTYENSDIQSFARAWTGFQRQARRGNVEARVHRVEPMNINGRWRDVFPKTDLYGGYIGDGFPLCVDLPPKHFLRRGATYRLLGSKASPELQQDR